MNRAAEVSRKTGETDINVQIDLDGSGESSVRTGVGMLDHLITLLARHSRFDITVAAAGDLDIDAHHTVEDVAITLGRALSQSLGERKGIVRMGHAIVPMDEALALVAVDIGGRGYAIVDAEFERPKVGRLPTELIGHFLHSLADESRINIHARLMSGKNDHHKAEAIFKALARALDVATRPDGRLQGQVPSTKGSIET
ncbi:MAG: imidazoleglycerol-phosphate dehydratase HisB [Chloroflexi bacterium]|nr:imidazoleglycerol-phosphate dehydratase HisB [Chloroflexota bacterium]